MCAAGDAGGEQRYVTPEKVLSNIEPGMRIFLGSGLAEPRTLVKGLLASTDHNLRDLDLVQLVSLGEAVDPSAFDAGKFRLQTFASGWRAGNAVAQGRADLIPCRFSQIPRRIATGQIPLDAAVIQVSPPDPDGRCGLGVAVDAALEALAASRLRVGEIHPGVPRTAGSASVRVTDFTFLVRSEAPLPHQDRWPVDALFDRLAAQVASVIPDGACLAFAFGPLFDALGPHLADRRDLGVHTPFFTDALMDLVKGGAVTNRKKRNFRGRCVASYAVGTRALMAWLDHNEGVAFHGLETVFNPVAMGRNPGFVSIHLAHRVDLSGRVTLPTGGAPAAPGPEAAVDFVNGAELSRGGMTIFALTSRDPAGRPNIRFSLPDAPCLFGGRESVDVVATEHGVAALRCRTLRERAQALIDVAHPQDRGALADRARRAGILYDDQVPPAVCTADLPLETPETAAFKGGVSVRFRALRPSDEEEMRRLFYRFSDRSVYYRYFSPVHAMPHPKMQAYVNPDCTGTVSIVGLADSSGRERIVAEARFVRDAAEASRAEVAFMVDDAYQGLGIAGWLLKRLIALARERNVWTLTADVLASNRGMMTVFERSGVPVDAKLADGIYAIAMDLGR